MNSKTIIKYRVTWKSDTQRTRREACFDSCDRAEKWYAEKLAEGKEPQLWKEETTTTFEALHQQENNS